MSRPIEVSASGHILDAVEIPLMHPSYRRLTVNSVETDTTRVVFSFDASDFNRLGYIGMPVTEAREFARAILAAADAVEYVNDPLA